MDIRATYGSNFTPCTVYMHQYRHGLAWYAVEDSLNVCLVDASLLVDGVDVETLPDVDFFTASKPIDSVETLEYQVNL
jgi:hypothetical protein